jgi:ligand-binding sensor domain-containing protein
VVREQGLTFFRVLQLARDASGHLWLGSERGTFRAPEADLRDVAVRRRRCVEGRNFGRDDGRPSRQCNGGAASSAMRTANGEVWFATARGLAVGDPARIDDRPRTPPPERRATRRVAQRCLR